MSQKKWLLSLALLGALCGPSWAQQQPVQTQPLPRVTTDASSTIAVTNTFQAVWGAQGAPQGPTRAACAIQNNGSHVMWVFSGLIASAAKTSSIVLSPGATYHCGDASGVVGTSAISITGTATEAFTASLDGSPSVDPASPAEGGGGVPSDVNLAQVAGATVATGHGTAAGALRVELPTDGTGVVGLAAGSTVAVTQATGTNLHTVVDSGTLTAVTAITNALPSGANLLGKVGIDQTTPGTTNGIQLVAATNVTTLTTAITRPADTSAYTANDALANSTSAPTAGGFTLTSACRASGGNGTILSAEVSASAGTAYQGEIWIFDQAVTATNDNAALSVSDSDILNLVGVIPFNTTDVNAANSISYVTGLNLGYTCSGTANLRYLVKIMAAVTPASAEVLNLRVQVAN